jgi:hypothetical protein
MVVYVRPFATRRTSTERQRIRTTGKLEPPYDARAGGGGRARISQVLLRWVVTGLAGLWLAGWVCEPLESHAQGSDPAYEVEYTGTADFSIPGVYGGDSSRDYAAGSIDLHVEWTAVGTGAFADALLLDDPLDVNAAPGTYQGAATFLRFSNLSGTLSKRVPDGQFGTVPAIITSSRDNCTSTLSQVPGAQLPYGSALSPSYDLQSEAFDLFTVLPLDAAYVQSDNAGSQCSISIPRGQLYGLPLYRPEIVADNGVFKTAVRPVFYTDQFRAGERSFDDSKDFDFDLETGYVAGRLGDGSFRTPPVGTWKGHIQSKIHVRTVQPGDSIFGN